jgi:hypothetical protein
MLRTSELVYPLTGSVRQLLVRLCCNQSHFENSDLAKTVKWRL